MALSPEHVRIVKSIHQHEQSVRDTTEDLRRTILSARLLIAETREVMAKANKVLKG